MIIDRLDNAYLYYDFDEKITMAFKFLENTDLNNLDIGKHEIDENEIFAIVQSYMTKDKEAALYEAHRRYIDIQYVIEGQESIGYTNIDQLKPATEYDEEKDIVFFEGTGDLLSIQSGTFAIFMPQDAHMPSVFVDKSSCVKKIVVKVKV